MKKVIYVQLLDEGTIVYRPVLSFQLSSNIYKVGEELSYEHKNEKWEFLPNTIVEVEEKNLDGDNVLVAVRIVDEV